MFFMHKSDAIFSEVYAVVNLVSFMFYVYLAVRYISDLIICFATVYIYICMQSWQEVWLPLLHYLFHLNHVLDINCIK